MSLRLCGENSCTATRARKIDAEIKRNKRKTDMFAVIRTGGKQYKVQKDDKIFVEKIEGEDGSVINLDQVLMIADDKKSTVGAPDR
jgi:hypothetical protein